GSFSLGFTITALPAPIAIGKNQHGTIAGKLKGLMIAATPSGWRIEYTSTRVDTPSEKPPFNRCGIPHAKSTTSSPRLPSPNASPRRADAPSVGLPSIQWLTKGSAADMSLSFAAQLSCDKLTAMADARIEPGAEVRPGRVRAIHG